MLSAAGTELDLAVVLAVVPEDVLIERQVLRAQNEGRVDDDEAVIRHRQKVYAERTAPLVAEYAGRGLLETVDGLGSVAEVAGRVFAAVERAGR